MMDQYTHLGVYGILVKDEQILLVQKSRGPHKGKWDLPGGSIEFGEEPLFTLKREFLEETGIEEIEAVIHSAPSYTLIHPFRENQLEEMHHIGIIYSVRIKNENYILKESGDGHDSLGAKWFYKGELMELEVTPFVEGIRRQIL
ncbi:NUDIX domain-containing protein [Paenibacillus sp. An7]|uniref:NUDIX domain-containing protein n=1 Tax=Paenibacillus sp. An7 TaxID=2689577 RepID=UPI001F1DA153|nr:NUDIX domain-containing protein [Paenibacillus sp. An7]